MSRRQWLLLMLLLVAAWLALFADKTPYGPVDSEVVQATLPRAGGDAGAGVSSRPSGETPRAPVATASAAKAAVPLAVAALIPRDQLIPAHAEQQVRRDLFPALTWIPPPPKPEKPLKPPPPMAPPLPFVYLGKKFEEGQWEAYLGSGEDVFIAREGMTLAGIYKVRSIQPPTMTLIYLPLKQSQTISIGGSP